MEVYKNNTAKAEESYKNTITCVKGNQQNL